MRILKIGITQKSGFIHIIPTDDEDLWHIYNLIAVGDNIKSATFRKITKEGYTGLKQISKKKVILTLKIVKISYFTQIDYLALEIKGINVQENEFMSLGQYHTLCIELNQSLTIYKQQWDPYHFKILNEIKHPENEADIAAIVMDEGVAHVCYIRQSITLIKHKIEKAIPKKKSGAELYEKEMQKFYQQCFEAILDIDFSKIKALIIGSPGFVKDNFYNYIKEKSQDSEVSQIFKKHSVLQKILLVKTASGYKDALSEALSDQSVLEKLSNTKATKEIKVLEQFFEKMRKNTDEITFGFKSVAKANSMDAIASLLISDKLFRTKDLSQRKQFNDIMMQVQHQGGEVYIFSSLHVTGEKLNNFTGIAAILRFPVQIEDSDDDDNDDLDQAKYNDEEEVKQFKKEDLQQIKNLFSNDELNQLEYEANDNDNSKQTKNEEQKSK